MGGTGHGAGAARGCWSFRTRTRKHWFWPRGRWLSRARRPGLLKLEGDTRTVTYLVCGVRGLSELASSLTGNPKVFTQIMQKVMTPLMDQALAHGGTIEIGRAHV